MLFRRKKMTFELDNDFESGVDIRVVGVGGGGNNAVNRMIQSGIKSASFVAVNTDKQALFLSQAPQRVPQVFLWYAADTCPLASHSTLSFRSEAPSSVLLTLDLSHHVLTIFSSLEMDA